LTDEIWDLWIPDAAATGVAFCRSKVDASVAGDRVLVHAAPARLDVFVRSTDEDQSVKAQGTGLERREEGPMSFLIRDGDQIRLEDGWPTDADIEGLVLLPGGEAGILKSWWHADDKREWRWRVEFHNHM
jgi:hypothetical protein